MKQANETVNPPKTEENPNLNLKNQEESLNFKKSDFLRGKGCLLYTSDAADDLLCVDLGGRRIIKKKNKNKLN